MTISGALKNFLIQVLFPVSAAVLEGLSLQNGRTLILYSRRRRRRTSEEDTSFLPLSTQDIESIVKVFTVQYVVEISL